MTRTRRRIRRLPRAAATLAGAVLAACDNVSFILQIRLDDGTTVRDSADITIVENSSGADERVPRSSTGSWPPSPPAPSTAAGPS